MTNPRNETLLESVPEPDRSQTDADPTHVDSEVTTADVDAIALPPSTDGRRSRFGRFLRWTVRLLLMAALIAAGVLAVVFGWPWVQDSVLDPLQANTDETAAIQTQMSVVDDRIAELENINASLLTQVETLEASDVTTEEALATVAAGTDQLTKDVSDVQTTALDQADVIADLRSASDGQASELAEFQRTMETLAEGAALTEQQVATNLAVLTSADLLARARLFLYQANYGLAAQDVAGAIQVLTPLADAEDGADPASIDAVVTRLELVQRSLPAKPVLASDDLDIAWGLLLGLADTTPTVAQDEPAPAGSLAQSLRDAEASADTTSDVGE